MALDPKWQPVFDNEDLAMKIIPMEPEEAQKVLAENGFDFTLEEILEAGTELYKMRESMNNGGELSEDDLDDVAGGCIIRSPGTILRAVQNALWRW